MRPSLLLALPALPVLLAAPSWAQGESAPPTAEPTTVASPPAASPAPATEPAPAADATPPATTDTSTTKSAGTTDTVPKASTATRRAPTAGPQLEGPRDGVPDCRASAALCWKNDAFALWPRLRLRTGYEFVQPDSQVLTVGQNDGFFLDQTRVGFDGAFRDDVRFRLIVDVVTALPGAAPNDPVQSINAAVRDAWVAWMPSDWFFVSAGQQFMPSDLEGSSTIASLPFVRRSVATSGVRPGHGFAVTGLSPQRQMGLVLGSTENAEIGNVALEYLVGVGNGNGQNVLGNDNKLPAAYVRLGAGWVTSDLEIRLGVGGRSNARTVGTLPNLFSESENVGFVDLNVRAMGFQLAGQAMARQTSFDTLFPDGGATDDGFGATVWLWIEQPFGIPLWGIKPGYRFSAYDPSSVFPDDQLLENTIGVRWDVPIDGLPLSLFVDGTLLTETGAGVRDLDNGRVTALLQLEL